MTTGPRIYNLFPLLAGPIEDANGNDWHSHLKHIAGMNFDWVALGLFHQPGESGNLYAIKDHYSLHSQVKGRSKKSPDTLLRDFVTAAGSHRLGVMMELVINRAATNALPFREHPEWFRHQNDQLLFNYDNPDTHAELVAWWKDYLNHYIALGVRGFICHAVCDVPVSIWQDMIKEGRKLAGDVLFIAKSLDCSMDQAYELHQAGFDFLFNSSMWWDFRSPWLQQQYETLRSIAPSIAFPETQERGRLAAEIPDDDPAGIKPHYRFRYLFAAHYSAGLMMPMGYEYAVARPYDVVHGSPEQWQEDLAATGVDISSYIAAVNALKAGNPVLNIEGPQRLIITPDDSCVVLVHTAGEEGCAIALINASSEQPAEVDADWLQASVGGTFESFSELLPGQEPTPFPGDIVIPLAPLQMRLFHGEYSHAHDYLVTRRELVPGWEVIDAILGADYEDPFAVRGMHVGAGGTLVVRTFQPGAERVEVIHAGDGKVVATLDCLHQDGFFAGTMGKRKNPFAYRLRIHRGPDVHELEDPYRFPQVLGEMDVHLLAEGTHLNAYERLGAQLTESEGVPGVSFAVWAPNARRVAVVGDFNNWDGRCHPMRLRHDCGVWEIFIPGIGEGEHYKYEIKGAHGELLPLKADPYGFAAELPPRTASIVCRTDTFEWDDGAWMEKRALRHERSAPIAIYEVHLGSWRRVAGEGNRYLSYRELADQLIPYVKELGFTHIELLPVTEYPFDGSWGYQPIGLFAPTSRFGRPADFKYFIESCHKAEIGVIVDWVPGHFPSDPHGLGHFDGTHLYEHEDPRLGYHQDWNTLIYNYGRSEVANYLLSNALFWMERYHIDGLRVDAVASMLYLDYSRREGEWIPNIYGGNENLEAIDFLRRMNELVYGRLSGVMTAAEESTSWPSVSHPTYLGGLGFGYKWNMGWMNDTLRYIGRESIHRRYHHNELTFGLLYAFSENFILPLSHDEVVHGKGSLLARMPGDSWQQFANLRAYYGFMWTHPGKKLLFMGGEFAQGREWNHDQGLDWHLLDIPWHSGVQKLVRDLNRLYRELPALHQRDCEAGGFQWIKANDSDESVFAYLRAGDPLTSPVVVICNFTPVLRQHYRVGVPENGFYRERINTDSGVYGGSNQGNDGGVKSEALPWDGMGHSITITLPPLATVIFELSERY